MSLAQQILEEINGLPLEMQQEALDFVEFLKQKQSNKNTDLKLNDSNGAKLAQFLQEASHKKLFSHIEDPVAWQREIRRDHSLPGRES